MSLRRIALRDFVIVPSLDLDLAGGFSVLTGETGAGKSILVDAIELLVGGRADAAVVREGAEKAELSAEFEQESEELNLWLKESDLEGDAGQLILRRTIDRSGRSRASIQSAVPRDVPASPAAGWTQIFRNGPRSRSRAFIT